MSLSAYQRTILEQSIRSDNMAEADVSREAAVQAIADVIENGSLTTEQSEAIDAAAVKTSENFAVAAAGANLANATLLDSYFNKIASGTGGVKLNATFTRQFVVNATGSAVNVYPSAAGKQIDALGNGVAYSLVAGASRLFIIS